MVFTCRSSTAATKALVEGHRVKGLEFRIQGLGFRA